jgi:D-alanine-D-alanine ligase-like ATP-grasp enzyme
LLGYSPIEIGNVTRVAEALTVPVTAKQLERAAAKGDKEALAEKLYFSSLLVAQAPKKMRTRRVWKLEQVPVR